MLFMKQKFIVKYISIIFIFATFMTSFHHHNDMQEHDDCQICTIQNNIVDIDTPIDITYFTILSTVSESITLSLENLQTQKDHKTFSARAPPFYS